MSATIVQEPQAWRGARVPMTGGSGFIGLHLVRRLTGLGADVHVVRRPTVAAREHARFTGRSNSCIESRPRPQRLRPFGSRGAICLPILEINSRKEPGNVSGSSS